MSGKRQCPKHVRAIKTQFKIYVSTNKVIQEVAHTGNNLHSDPGAFLTILYGAPGLRHSKNGILEEVERKHVGQVAASTFLEKKL